MSDDGPTRLALASRMVRRDHLHGAWWPRSRDLRVELPLLLAGVLEKIEAVHGVTLNRSEWPDAPLLLQPLPTRNPTISWYGLHEPDQIVLHCSGHNRLALLVLPPETPRAVAETAMRMACAPGNTLGPAATLAEARLAHPNAGREVPAPD